MFVLFFLIPHSFATSSDLCSFYKIDKISYKVLFIISNKRHAFVKLIQILSTRALNSPSFEVHEISEEEFS